MSIFQKDIFIACFMKINLKTVKHLVRYKTIEININNDLMRSWKQTVIEFY